MKKILVMLLCMFLVLIPFAMFMSVSCIADTPPMEVVEEIAPIDETSTEMTAIQEVSGNTFTDMVTQWLKSLFYTVLITLSGYIGLQFKKFINDKTKRKIVKTCVCAVEQIYKDLHGEDKYNKVVESATDMLAERGIKITEFEIKILIESAVNEFNKPFIKEKANE